MNRMEISKRALPWLAAAALGVAVSMPAYAVDCATPKGIDETRGCAAAKQGVEALRHYVERTRMIHNLYFPDYAPYVPGAGMASDEANPTHVATAK